MMGADGVSRVAPERCRGTVRVVLVAAEERWGRRTERRLASTTDDFTIDRVASPADASRRVERNDPDCVVCDARLGENGLALLEKVRETNGDLPFVLATARADETLAREAIARGVTDWIRADRAPDELLVSRIETAVRSYRAERALAREQRTMSSILATLAATTDRVDALEAFCRQIVTDWDAGCVWIASEGASGGVVPVVSVGRDNPLGKLAAHRITSDADVSSQSRLETSSDRDRGLDDHPAIVALSRGETTTRAPIATMGEGSDAGDWRVVLADHGVERVAAIPIASKADAVLVVEDAGGPFDDAELHRLQDHADAIADVLSTPEWEHPGPGDGGQVMDVFVGDSAAPLVALVDGLGGDVTVEVPSAVDRGDGATLYRARVDGLDADGLANAVRSVENLELVDADPAEGEGLRCELVAEGHTPERAIVERGGRVVETLLEDGVASVSATVPGENAAASITATLEGAFDEIECAVRSTAAGGGHEHGQLLASLTVRQRDILDHAFLAGYYEIPRGISATELAERFDIARATLTQHLRTAERKVLGEVLTE